MSRRSVLVFCQRQGAAYQSFDVGSRLTSGQILLVNDSGQPMTVLQVRPLLEPDGALTFLGAYLAGDDKSFAMTDYLLEFPPTREEWGSFVPAVICVPKSVECREDD